MMRAILAAASAALFTVAGTFGVGAQGAAPDPLPAKRLIVAPDTDFSGADLQQLFDTTREGCQRACLGNDACVAFTFNSRNNSCFPKSSITGESPYAGALSASVIPYAQTVQDRAGLAAGQLGFLGADTLTDARKQASALPWQFLGDDRSGTEWAVMAADAALAGDRDSARRYAGTAAALTDDPRDWLALATYGFDLYRGDNDRGALRDEALSASVNAFLRSQDPALSSQSLLLMAQVLESQYRGRDMIPALTLAATYDDTSQVDRLLDYARGEYGFRITGNTVDNNLALPRFCAVFSEDLLKTGVDYETYLRLPQPDMTAEPEGNQLCITGGTHGQAYNVTFRAGLPAKSGEVLADDVDQRFFIGDRDPSARFPGRGYVLPRIDDAALPIETVNLDEVDLTLSRLTDRNLVRAFQQDFVGAQIEEYEIDSFDDQIAAPVWTGHADVRKARNETVTSRLPLSEALAGQAPGIFILRAAIPGADPYDNAPATQWFVLTDLGLTTMQGTDGLTTVVRGLSDAGARAGVSLRLISSANDVLGTATTDDQGVAQFPAGLTRGTGGMAPAALVAELGGDITFLSLNGPAFDLSDRGVEGAEPAGPIDVFLATDRGAYRAGEVIHLTALARNAQAHAIDGLPVTAILTRPDGVEYARETSAQGQAGGHVFAFPVGETVPRGTWTLAVKSDLDAPGLATTQVLVEDFLPERIDFTVSLPEGALTLADTVPVSLQADYLFGAPAANLPVNGNYALDPRTTLPDFPGYRFGLHDAVDGTWREYFSLGETDAAGFAETDLSFADYQPYTAVPVDLTVTMQVREGSGRAVERQATRLLTPSAPVLGIRPQAETFPQGSEAAFDLIALSPSLQPIDMDVHYRISRVQTEYQWYNQYGNWNWEPYTTRSLIAEGDASLGDGTTTVSAPVDWGQYEIVVTSADDPRVAASAMVDAGWYAPADAVNTPDMLDVSLDAPEYVTGDTATLRFVPRYAGTALITVMTDHLIDMQIVEAREGSNEVPLTVTPDWGAGAYVSATVLRPMDVAAGHNPARAMGLDYAPVAPGDKALAVSIDAPEESMPRGPLAATVHVAGVLPGDTAYVTLAAVDVGILNLTGFKTPDPQAYYFGQRRLGMELRDVYGRLIDGLQGEMGRVRSGGDAASLARQSPPPTEQLVAFFTGPVTVDADGNASVPFDIPAFNGTIRLMALAWSNTGVGSAQHDVLVRDPVVAQASLPRFLAPGDSSRMLLELTHATGPAGAVQVSVSANGVTLDTSSLPASVTLADHGSASFSLPIVAGEVGDYPVQIRLVTPDGTELQQDLILPVRRTAPQIGITRRFTLDPGATFTLNADALDGLYPDTASAVLSVGPMARLDVPGLLAQLAAYPYGCTEQITSQTLPLLYLSSVSEQMGIASTAEIDARIGDGITAVLARQTSTGSFDLWPGSAGGAWLDAYVTDFLSQARAAGATVPDIAFRNALGNLRNQVNYAPDFTATTNGGGTALAYQLYVLAREGEAATSDLRYYADAKADEFATPLAVAQLGAALALYGDQPRADALFARAGQMIAVETLTEKPVWRADFGTALRDTAAVLDLAVAAGSDAIDREALLTRISTATGPFSTQESAWSLMAARSLVTDSLPGLAIDGQQASPMVRLPAGAAATDPVEITNEGDIALPVTLTTLGQPVGEVTADGYGYAIRREYFTPDGDPASPDGLASGERLVTVLTITPTDDTGARLMVNDPLPAGFEIDNPRLLSSGDVSALPWLETAEPEMAEFLSERFLAALDWRSEDPFRLAYMIRAVTPGSYAHPAATVEDMYRPAYRARTGQGQVTVVE